MGLNIIKTSDPTDMPAVIMMVYGAGGVGKTTFATTAKKPLIVDCEGGTKYLGLRGIDADVARIKNWSEMKDVLDETKNYDTIIIDPIGELMEKLSRHMVGMRDSKLVQKDGSPTMAGWGFLKKTMRSYLKVLRDSGKHVIIIAHVDEQKDGDRVIRRPMIQTKLSEEIVNMVDVVGYMTMVSGGEGQENKRAILVDADSDTYVAKDRTGQLGTIVEPDFQKIVKAIEGSEVYAWSSDDAKKKKEPKAKAKPKAKKEVKPEPTVDEIVDELPADMGGTAKTPEKK